MNRRDLLSGVASIPTIAMAQHGHANKGAVRIFEPKNEPPRVRKSFYDLNDEELRNLCRAIGYMRSELPLEHPLQWDNYARIHALHCTEPSASHPPVHWSWHFLPWHKGYLFFLERILASILTTVYKIDGSKFALPYWDWISHKGMPNTKTRMSAGIPSPFFGYDILQENMVTIDNLGFDNSALFDGNRGPTISKSAMDPANELTQDSKDHVNETLNYMSPRYIISMLAVPFDQFGGKSVVDRKTGQGLLEQGPHNNGHDWIGTRIGKNRTMGTLRSAAADPMFYMHHANIDRIWTFYTLPQPDPNGEYGKQTYDFYDVDGSLVRMSVKDIVTSINNITYAPSQIDLSVSLKVNHNTVWRTVNVGKELYDKPLSIAVPEDMFNTNMTLLDVDLGVIKYTGKYNIKIVAGDKTIGKISMMDGDHRRHNTDDMTHSFSVMVLGSLKTTAIVLLPPANGFQKIFIKSIRYKSF